MEDEFTVSVLVCGEDTVRYSTVLVLTGATRYHIVVQATITQ